VVRIRDPEKNHPGSGTRILRVKKKVPDPGSGTLITNHSVLQIQIFGNALANSTKLNETILYQETTTNKQKLSRECSFKDCAFFVFRTLVPTSSVSDPDLFGWILTLLNDSTSTFSVCVKAINT
jgi:hypothetical protein